MPEGLPRIPSVADAVDLMPGIGDGLSLELSDEITASTRAAGGSIWWLVTTISVFVGMMLHGEMPLWIRGVVAAEIYASVRLLINLKGGGDSRKPANKSPTRHRRLRHFTSVRLRKGAPVDEIVASFLALDELPCVRSIELGSNASAEGHSREHGLGFLVTFSSSADRFAFLRSERRAAFKEWATQYVDEWYVFDFESGAV